MKIRTFIVIQTAIFCIGTASLPSCGWIEKTIGKISGEMQEKTYEKEQDIIIPEPPSPLSQYELPPISFATTDNEPHSARMIISLGYEKNPVLGAELKEKKDQLCHIIRVLSSAKSIDDIKDAEGLAGLGAEIKANINTVLDSGKILEVYYKEMTRN